MFSLRSSDSEIAAYGGVDFLSLYFSLLYDYLSNRFSQLKFIPDLTNG